MRQLKKEHLSYRCAGPPVQRTSERGIQHGFQYAYGWHCTCRTLKGKVNLFYFLPQVKTLTE